MNLKDFLQSEKEKIRAIPTTKEKLVYIWDYYKILIIAVAAALAFLVYFIVIKATTLEENWIYVTISNTFADVGDDSSFKQEFVDYSGFDTSEKNVVFNANSFFDYTGDVTGNTYFEAFVTYTDAGTLDAVTMQTDSLTALGATGRLLDLNSESCAEIREKYGDRFLYAVPNDETYSTEPVPVGIDISDSRLVTECHAYSETAALGIGANSQHLDAVLTFLDFLFEE